jgi:serine/threonine protein kinase
VLGNGGRGAVSAGTYHNKPVAARRVGVQAPSAHAAARGSSMLSTPSSSLEALRVEMSALSQLRHPNLLRLIGLSAIPAEESGVGVDAGLLVCEMCRTSLLDAVRGGLVDVGSWSAQLLKLIHEVVAGLLFLHQAGAVHGRLHPRNVLLSSHLRAKLSDYHGQHDGTPSSGPQPPFMWGNAGESDGDNDARWAYLAPEVISRALTRCNGSSSASGLGSGLTLPSRAPRSASRQRMSTLGKPISEEAETAAAADIWSVGCLIAFVGTGEPPYAAAVHAAAASVPHDPPMAPMATLSTLYDAARAHSGGPLHRLEQRSGAEQCPASVAQLAARCVRDDASGRPTAVQIFAELRAGTLATARRARRNDTQAASDGGAEARAVEEATSSDTTAAASVATAGARDAALALRPPQKITSGVSMPRANALPAPMLQRDSARRDRGNVRV